MSQKRPPALSSDSSNDADTQVYSFLLPHTSPSSAAFLDSQSLDLFSNATQMKVTQGAPGGEKAKNKKGNKKYRTAPPPDL